MMFEALFHIFSHPVILILKDLSLTENVEAPFTVVMILLVPYGIGSR